MDRSSGPRGRARKAMRLATRTTMSGSTRKLTSALVDASRPKLISPGSLAWTLSCAEYTSATVARRSGANGERARRGERRPSRIPTPIPRKLAISRKLLKNPT
jgi:hypothetical protein